MAFCNSCGTSLQPGARFCPKCGAAVPEAASAPAAPAAQKPADVLKIVLIVVVAVVVLGIIGIGMATLVGLRIARHTRVQENGENVRVETPFGTVETSKNPADAARDLGVPVYPGAQVLKGNAANIHMGAMHTVAAQFETTDSVEKVADFYKANFPSATIKESGSDHYTLVSTSNKNVITVSIESVDGKTRISIANVSGRPMGGDTSSN